MKNFYEETIEDIKRVGRTLEDIAWIGSYSVEIPINQFFKVAKATTYDNGWGRAEMPIDLRIVFKDGGYLERREYDGSEWWQYIAPMRRPSLKARLVIKAFTDPVNSSLGDPVLSDFIYKGANYD